MEYTIQKLAALAKVSTRTLRYYDEAGILKPARINSSGYRIYGANEVSRLQQIMFYRELDVSIEEIRKIMTSPDFDELAALSEHHARLLDRQKQLNALILNVEKTIAMKKGGNTMNDNEKFEGFKQKLIDENEKKYGKEIRTKYGNEKIDKSNAMLKNMTQEQMDKANSLASEILEALKAALDSNDPAGKAAQKAAALHREWLGFYWDSYSKEAHASLAQMYTCDERFKAYYDEAVKPGAAEFLKDAILIYTGMKE